MLCRRLCAMQFCATLLCDLTLFAMPLFAVPATASDVGSIAPHGVSGFALLPADAAKAAGDRAANSNTDVGANRGLATKLAPTTIAPTSAEIASGIRRLLADIKPGVVGKGLAPATFDRIAASIRPVPEVLARLGAQPELARPIASYIVALTDESRAAEGRRQLEAQRAVLTRIEAAFGVPAPILVAIWGIESRYGTRQGSVRVLDGLATLAAAGERRQEFWRQQLIAALEIVARGDIAEPAFVGSWAGAVGHTQFIPTTYLARAVDFDGDGRRDMIGSAPDALASAAHLLKSSGWQSDLPWGLEVKLPTGFDFAFSTPGRAKPVELWDQMKVRGADGTALPRLVGDLQLLLPAGAGGPAFLVTRNFRAILAYNNAMSYALSVGLLADRIAGGAGVVSGWPIEETPLDRTERMEMQRLLERLGYSVGGIDGVMGDGTRGAIRSYQGRTGQVTDGHPNRELLERLRIDVAESVANP